MGLRRFLLLLSTVVAMFFVAAVPASAQVAPPPAPLNPISGPAAAQILETYLYPDGLIKKPAVLRAGNSKFGNQHIAVGGTHKRTFNHELTPQAKLLWAQALAKPPVGAAHFFGGKLFTQRFFANDGVRTYARTMCVVVDERNLEFAGQNYGPKGILTAYWVRNDAGPTGAGCNILDEE
jgi:hypothetical protein